MLFTQSACEYSVNAIVGPLRRTPLNATATATTTATATPTAAAKPTITATPPQRWLFVALLLHVAATRPMTTTALDWQHVKPMYLVSMFPTSYDMHTSLSLDASAAASASATRSSKSEEHSEETIAGIGAEDNTEDSREPEPLVLNLETTPLLDSMMPEGAMAMDRIFGGNVGNPHCFPYQAGMLLQRPKGLYWCGGSLISDQFVLTAAHCVDMAKRALVFLGANEIKNAKEKGQVRLMVHSSNFIIYPTWNPKRLKDDIALVRLPHSVGFNERISPIQLPKRHYEYRSFKNKLGIASGWGRYSTGVHAISNVLRYVQLQIVDGHTCKRNFPLSYRGTNICTSGRNAKSTCNGDSGGPLVLQRKHSKKRVLVGITSFGSIYGCDRGYPAAFTKVASYLDWISDEAGVHPHQDSTHAVFFDKYLKNYHKIHKDRFVPSTERETLEEDELDDQPDGLDTLHTAGDQLTRPGFSFDSFKRKKIVTRKKPTKNSEYEFYFL